MLSPDDLFSRIASLVMSHSPSGTEMEVDQQLVEGFRTAGLSPTIDAAGNIIAKIEGQGGGRLAVTAHKDEIGASVVAIEQDGIVRVRKLGGSFPWVYGEGVVDLLGDRDMISGILSFGSRHVSHASPQHAHKEDAPLKWADAWIETKLDNQALAEAGIRVGTTVVVGRHRKAPFRLGGHIASYALDNKASLALLLSAAETIRGPLPEVWLVATAREEIGALGAMYLTRQHNFDALIGLEIAPIAPEYQIRDSDAPVLLMEDAIGQYDGTLNEAIRAAARHAGLELQLSVVNGFGSDGSYAMRSGNVPRAACIGFPANNTHGFEIARLDAIANCGKLIETICERALPSNQLTE